MKNNAGPYIVPCVTFSTTSLKTFVRDITDLLIGTSS